MARTEGQASGKLLKGSPAVPAGPAPEGQGQGPEGTNPEGTNSASSAEGMESETSGTGAADPGGFLPSSRTGGQCLGEAPGDSAGDSAVSSSGECRSRCKTANPTPTAKYRPTGPTVAINRVLTWNLHGLHGVKILQLMNKVHSMRPDVVVATETELQDENPPSIPGYISMVPKTLVSSKVRTVMYTRRELQAEQLSTPRDVPIVAARIGNSAIVGLYRQYGDPQLII